METSDWPIASRSRSGPRVVYSNTASPAAEPRLPCRVLATDHRAHVCLVRSERFQDGNVNLSTTLYTTKSPCANNTRPCVPYSRPAAQSTAHVHGCWRHGQPAPDAGPTFRMEARRNWGTQRARQKLCRGADLSPLNCPIAIARPSAAFGLHLPSPGLPGVPLDPRPTMNPHRRLTPTSIVHVARPPHRALLRTSYTRVYIGRVLHHGKIKSGRGQVVIRHHQRASSVAGLREILGRREPESVGESVCWNDCCIKKARVNHHLPCCIDGTSMQSTAEAEIAVSHAPTVLLRFLPYLDLVLSYRKLRLDRRLLSQTAHNGSRRLLPSRPAAVLVETRGAMLAPATYGRSMALPSTSTPNLELSATTTTATALGRRIPETTELHRWSCSVPSAKVL